MHFRSRPRPRTVAALVAALPLLASAANLGGFEIVGESGVSAQMAFLAQDGNVWIIDKTENNPPQINGHPAWATVYNITTNEWVAKDVMTNSFCAGGTVLGDGRWLNVGGNQAVTYGGAAVNEQPGPVRPNPYGNGDGRAAIRTLDLRASDEWVEGVDFMTGWRWYPSLETLGDGSAIIVGGDQWGGYINDPGQNNPTYEFYPPRGGAAIHLDFLEERTMPVNLYPLLWLLPSGRLFFQAMYAAMVWDLDTQTETAIPDIPHAARVYPASGATAMLPLTPANNYTASFLFCGGQDIPQDGWGTAGAPPETVVQKPADTSCVSIAPDAPGAQWVEEDPLPEGRTMGNFIWLPDGKLLLLNGCETGTAGYGNVSFAIGQSYGDHPLHQPLIWDPDAPRGSRISREGLKNSTVDRMYHSVATLLEDGSVWVSGSNANVDVITTPERLYNTEYRVERWYPLWYDDRRPQPQGLPDTLSYGGDKFDVILSDEDLKGDSDNLNKTKAIVIRTGFSTHAINFGQRYLELPTAYTATSAGAGTLHVGQLPPNPNIFAPGPALLFIVVDGVPSIGQWVMVGSGEIGTQPTAQASQLAASQPWSGGGEGDGNGEAGSEEEAGNGAAASFRAGDGALLAVAVAVALFV